MSRSTLRSLFSNRALSGVAAGALALILSGCGDDPIALDDGESGGATPVESASAKIDVDITALSQLMATLPTDAPIWASDGSSNGRVELCRASDAKAATQKGTEIAPTYSVLIANGDFAPGTRLEWRYSGCGNCVIKQDAAWILVDNRSFGTYNVRSFEPDGRQGTFSGSIDVVAKAASECRTIVATNGARSGENVELCSMRDEVDGRRNGFTVTPTSTRLAVNGKFDPDMRFEWRYSGCGNCVIEPSAREVDVKNNSLGTYSVRSLNADGSYGAFSDAVTVASKECKAIIVSGSSVGNVVEIWTPGDYLICREAGVNVTPAAATQISVNTSFFPEGTQFEWYHSGCNGVVARGTTPLTVDEFSYGKFIVHNILPDGSDGEFYEEIRVKPKAPPCTLPPPGLNLAPRMYVGSESYPCQSGYGNHGCKGVHYFYDIANKDSFGSGVRFQELDTKYAVISEISQTRVYDSWSGWGPRYRLRAVDGTTGLTSAWVSAPYHPDRNDGSDSGGSCAY